MASNAPGRALSEHGACLVGGTVTLDDVSFTTKIVKYIAEGKQLRLTNAPRSSVLAPLKPSPGVTCWNGCFW